MRTPPKDIDREIERAARLVREAGALVITAGAGMGVDSGLPDFRGKEGFWRAYPVIAKLGLSFEQMAQPGWFDQSPQLAWAFYGHRLNLYRKTEPHTGFQRLLDCGKHKTHGCFVFTSNVDGQFQKAGFEPDRIVECHGSVHHLQCCLPCNEIVQEASREAMRIDEEKFLAIGPLPKCPQCEGMARPNVLMFGDGSWLASRSQAQETRLHQWLRSLKEANVKPAVIEIGAGTAIPSVRNFSERMAAEFETALIRINPREADVPEGQIGLPLTAEVGLRRIFESILSASG